MSERTLADEIRYFVNEQYFKPARERGEKAVGVRAGDVHSRMNLTQRLPAICGAIGSNKMEDEYHVKRIEVRGPINGANAYFVFRL